MMAAWRLKKTGSAGTRRAGESHQMDIQGVSPAGAAAGEPGQTGQPSGLGRCPHPGEPWQDNATDRGLRWRERAAYLSRQRVFRVDYLVCRRCRLGWVEDPATEDGYERCGLAAAGLTQLRGRSGS